MGLKFREGNKIIDALVSVKGGYRYFNKLDAETQREMYNLLMEDKQQFLDKFMPMFAEDNPEAMQKMKEKEEKEAKLQIGAEEDLTKQLAKQGVHNPTETLLKAMNSNGIGADFGKLFTGFGGLSLNSFQQMEANAHKVDQKQMFMLIAQQDKTIKLLEEQNADLKQQNEQIINLLTQLVNK